MLSLVADIGQRIPGHRSAYLSVIADQWTTLTGPPSTLQHMFASCPELAAAPHLSLPIEAAVHAPHLPALDFDFIIGSSAFHDRQPSPNATIISTSSLEPYECQTLRDLLHQMLVDISQNTLQVSSAMQTALTLSEKARIDITIIGPTTQTALLKKLTDTTGAVYSIREAAELAKALPSDRPGCQDIAIIGYSGRFPGGEDMEELWNTIHEAKDLHTEVRALCYRFRLRRADHIFCRFQVLVST